MANFIEAIAAMRAGMTLDELSKRLTEVVAAVRTTGKAGKLDLSLIIKPAGRGESVALTLEDKIKTTLPVMDRGTTIFYATKDNELSKRDPRQMELEGLKIVEMDRDEDLKEVNDER